MTIIESETLTAGDIVRAALLADLERRLARAGRNELRVVERIVALLEQRRGRDIFDHMADDLINLVVDELLLEDAEVERQHEAARDQIVPIAAPADPDGIDPIWTVR